MGTPISESAEYLFLIDLKFIFKEIFQLEISEKIFGMKIIKILKADFKKFIRKFFLEIYFLLSISSEARIST